MLILLIGMSVIGLQGVWVAQQSLSQLGQDKLQLLNQQKATALTNYYRQLETQAHVLSHTPTVRQALQAFSGVFYAMDTATFEANQPDDYSFKRYYKNQVLPRMVGLQAHDLDLTGFAPVGRRARQLQASYMAANELPVEEKFLFNPLNDTSAYGQLHRQYHNYFRQIFEASQLADFYLIEPQQGNIVYSTAKRIDFATSLLNGPQRRSLLRQAFDRARRQNPPAKAFITDFALYDPALRAPNQFVAMPVFADSALVGVVAFATGLAPVANIMTENQNWAKHGLNKQTQSYILGMDGVLRTPLRENIEKDALFWQQVKKSPHVSFTKPYAPEANQSALYLTLNNQVYKQAIEKNLPGGQLVFNNYNNTKMQAVYHKFNRSGFDWIIISQGSYHEAQGALYKFSSQVLITSLLTLVIVIWLGLWLISKFIEPIKLLTKRLTALAKGASVPKLEVSGTDEVSESHRALNGLNQRLLQAANYASQISQSTLQHDLTPAGPDDQLALALNQLRNNLQKANQEQQKRSWLNQGVATFSDLLRQNNNNPELMAANLVADLVKYLDITMGGIYVHEQKMGGSKESLKLLAAYAYDRQKFLDRSFNPGDGIVGQVYREGKPMYFKELPNNYFKIKSGLGSTSPSVLLVVPLLVNNQKQGVLELAAMEPIEQYKRDFVVQISETIATTLASIALNEQTRKLLEQSQDMAEQMQTQEEMMRQNLEEMQATQEEQNRKVIDYEKRLAEKDAEIKRLKG